jgi:hypothetical protein
LNISGTLRIRRLLEEIKLYATMIAKYRFFAICIYSFPTTIVLGLHVWSSLNTTLIFKDLYMYISQDYGHIKAVNFLMTTCCGFTVKCSSLAIVPFLITALIQN